MHFSLVCLILPMLTVLNQGFEIGIPNPKEFAFQLNSQNLTWKAADNFGRPLSWTEMKQMAGTILRKPRLKVKRFPPHLLGDSPIPKTYDSRKQYPYCASLFKIHEQSNCGSCYAIASASALSDRLCIASKGAVNSVVSAESVISCCKSCGKGCAGGYIDKSWVHFKKEGDITGGEFDSKEGCQPYSISPCKRNTKDPECMKDERSTPQCKKYCTNPEYKNDYGKEVYQSRSAYALKNSVPEIQREIMLYGPVVTGFNVYADFYTYKSGVYQYKGGESTGGHAVRVIGWGEENSTPYWLAINSWGKTWGENGTFKIRRGSNECGFEKFMVAGEAKLP